LFALSDGVAHFGLEHHESSDDRVPERALLDEEQRKAHATLLPHEFVHSWNGKYRRPADIATPDFQQPMRTSLLWVYEGLTQYLGQLLAERSGLWSAEDYRDKLALIVEWAGDHAGRTWRPLEDTAVSAQLLYPARRDWEAWRRSTDFYDESTLIWLDADTLIREKTGGTRSLEDFIHDFLGGVGPGMKLLAANGRRWSEDWSQENLRAAVAATKKSTKPLELLLQNGEFIRSYSVNYHGGEKYPRLERIPGREDLLSTILKSHASALPIPAPRCPDGRATEPS